MGILKDILIGGAAWKALKRSDRPGVVVPPNCTLLGMEHIGFGSRWKIIYCTNKNPNVKLSFTIGPGTTGMNSGGNKWKFHWS
jgi:hypothetical protein